MIYHKGQGRTDGLFEIEGDWRQIGIKCIMILDCLCRRVRNWGTWRNYWDLWVKCVRKFFVLFLLSLPKFELISK